MINKKGNLLVRIPGKKNIEVTVVDLNKKIVKINSHEISLMGSDFNKSISKLSKALNATKTASLGFFIPKAFAQGGPGEALIVVAVLFSILIVVLGDFHNGNVDKAVLKLQALQVKLNQTLYTCSIEGNLEGAQKHFRAIKKLRHLPSVSYLKVWRDFCVGGYAEGQVNSRLTVPLVNLCESADNIRRCFKSDDSTSENSTTESDG